MTCGPKYIQVEGFVGIEANIEKKLFVSCRRFGLILNHHQGSVKNKGRNDLVYTIRIFLYSVNHSLYKEKREILLCIFGMLAIK